MQQYLPFTVLKLIYIKIFIRVLYNVATVPTVYGIETHSSRTISAIALSALQQYLPFTVLKQANFSNFVVGTATVATVPTVYGIETHKLSIKETVPLQLQQYLPFTVLKQIGNLSKLEKS